MYEGNPADLRMVKLISADAVLDEAIHKCQVFKYDMEEDFIYLELKENDLTTISLDAKYRCYIATRNELLCCTGVVKAVRGRRDNEIRNRTPGSGKRKAAGS